MSTSKPASAPETCEASLSAYASQNGADERPARAIDTETPYVLALLAASGIPAAVAAAWLCRPDMWTAPFWFSVVLQAAIYVFATMAIGSLGAWLLWTCLAIEPSFSLRSFLRTTIGCWGFIPVWVLLYRLHSVWLLAMSLMMAAYLVVCVRRMQGQEKELGDQIVTAPGYCVPVPAFSTEVLRGRFWRPIWMSMCVQTALLLMILGGFRPACLLLVVPALSLAWQVSSRQSTPIMKADRRRVFVPLLVAVLATIMVILPQFKSVAFKISDRGLYSSHRVLAKPKPQNGQGTRERSYVSVILWPPHAKRAKPLPPVPHVSSTGLFSTRSKPTVIPFDGPYWYFQVPDKKPGANAHVIHGSPMEEDVHSNNFLPLLMAAHQVLDTPIDIESCSELDLALTNGDKSPGEIDVGVVLTDAATKQSQYLGTRPLPSSTVRGFSIHRGSVDEKLRFHILNGKLSRFDQITVLIIPAMDRSLAGARVAVKQFELIPR